jgi:hypothetical protein
VLPCRIVGVEHVRFVGSFDLQAVVTSGPGRPWTAMPKSASARNEEWFIDVPDADVAPEAYILGTSSNAGIGPAISTCVASPGVSRLRPPRCCGKHLDRCPQWAALRLRARACMPAIPPVPAVRPSPASRPNATSTA